jgi:acetate kinase
MRILVVNAGSTTLKLSVLDGEQERFAATIEKQTPAAALPAALDQARAAGVLPVEAVGHRIVHGGREFSEGVLVSDDVLARLAAVNDMAPLHNPPALATLAEARRLLPDLPQVLAFDTAFHARIPRHASSYAIPRKWTDEWGIRKYGFHGLSHAYCARRATELLPGAPNAASARVVVAHLGGGCSLSASIHGNCLDTTMGFTPLDGLMMATRCGSIDPGAVLYLQKHHGFTADQLEDALNHQAGLLGVSGVSGDFREVQKAAGDGVETASLALEMFG